MQQKEIAQYALNTLLENGADKANVNLTFSEKNELNLEAENITLLRTTLNYQLSLRVIKDHKVGSIALNKTDKESIDLAVKNVLDMAAGSQPDDAQDIAPKQPSREFSYGVDSPDLDKMYDRMDEFRKETKSRYPKTILEEVLLDYTRLHSYTLNSNGVDFKETKGNYNFSLMFTSKEGSKVSSFNYDGICLNDLDTPLIELGQMNTLLRQSSEQIELKPIEGKFVGEVILTPAALSDFLGSYLGYLQDYYLISDSSVFKNKLEEKIADTSLTIESKPQSEEHANRSFVTSDGFETENLEIIKGGILKTYLLSHYGANKTKLKMAKNEVHQLSVKGGDQSFEDLVKSIDKGLLLCRFSGGYPGGNGEFSGVAKNSYYIENGKIKFPVQEVMVSGNLVEGFKNISGISKERNDDGNRLLPWMKMSGLTISGK